jgi:hypothetical protein
MKAKLLRLYRCVAMGAKICMGWTVTAYAWLAAAESLPTSQFRLIMKIGWAFGGVVVVFAFLVDSMDQRRAANKRAIAQSARNQRADS